MKKINTISLAVLAVLSFGFSGCGNSSESESSNSYTTEVSRGDVYDANVTDSSTPARVAVQVKGKNQYRFNVAKSEITFPIVVNGGYVDVNDNGILDTEDTLLNIEMKSYSDVVTPVTTYLADEMSVEAQKLNAQELENLSEEKLQELVALINTNRDENRSKVTAEDLLKPATDTTFEAALAINAVYAELTDVATSGSSFDLNDVNDSYNTIRAQVREGASAVEIEKYTIQYLGIETFTEEKIKEYKNALAGIVDSALELNTSVNAGFSVDAGIASSKDNNKS